LYQQQLAIDSYGYQHNVPVQAYNHLIPQQYLIFNNKYNVSRLLLKQLSVQCHVS